MFAEKLAPIRWHEPANTHTCTNRKNEYSNEKQMKRKIYASFMFALRHKFKTSKLSLPFPVSFFVKDTCYFSRFVWNFSMILFCRRRKFGCVPIQFILRKCKRKKISSEYSCLCLPLLPLMASFCLFQGHICVALILCVHYLRQCFRLIRIVDTVIKINVSHFTTFSITIGQKWLSSKHNTYNDRTDKLCNFVMTMQRNLWPLIVSLVFSSSYQK